MILFLYVDTLKFYFVGVYMSFLLLLVLQRFVFIRLPGNLAFFFGVWFFFFFSSPVSPINYAVSIGDNW